MIEESEALERILASVPASGSEMVSLSDALDRYALDQLRAGVASPAFDNSAMDGYAVRAADACREGATLRVTREQAAGEDLQLEVREGEAVRIFTGAPIPRGAGAVVMQEDVEVDRDRIRIREPIVEGEFIRRAGSDLCEGQVILRPGERINPQRIGLLASQGIQSVKVGSLPDVVVVTTGDELVAADKELKAGQIYNSNGPMLSAQVQRQAADAPVRHFHAKDEPDELAAVIRKAVLEAQVVIISGGVSVGDRDLVKEILGEIGIETSFWRVRVKPGKPFLFGQSQETLVFGLPGNPVSSFVTFQVFVRPAILRWMGADDRGCFMPTIRCEVRSEITNAGDRPHYVRGRVGEDGVFEPVGLQQSHALSGLASGNALVRMEPDSVLRAGEPVRVLLV